MEMSIEQAAQRIYGSSDNAAKERVKMDLARGMLRDLSPSAVAARVETTRGILVPRSAAVLATIPMLEQIRDLTTDAEVHKGLGELIDALKVAQSWV